MLTRTESYHKEDPMGSIASMEESGWAVRQIYQLQSGVVYVVFEREPG